MPHSPYRAAVQSPPPPVTSAARTAGVLAGGVASTALSLVGVFFLSRSGTNIMGWYANYILPVGALVVGMVASSGYGIAAWLLGCKISGRLVWSVVALLLCGYAAAHYLEFRLLISDDAIGDDGMPFSFWSYFDFATRNFRWEEHGKEGDALGLLGYGLRGLELCGFLGGGALIPLALRKKPYCDACARYKRSPLVAILPAGEKPGFLGRAQAGEAERGAALLQGARQGLNAIFVAARTREPLATREAMNLHGPLRHKRTTEKLAARIRVYLVHCPTCCTGALRADMVTGHGKQIQIAQFATETCDESLVSGLLRASRTQD